MDNVEIDFESPRYKKKAKHSPPKKSKHKHEYIPCVLEYDRPDYSIEYGQVKVKDARISAYCPMCGKIGGYDVEHWWRSIHLDSGCYRVEPTEDTLRELNPETRTLPTFWVDDWLFPKFVTLEEG